MKPTVLYLFLGGLGVGKTTALRSILAQKPADELWGVVMNEFGNLGVDQLLLPESDTIPQITVAGGCICCSGGHSLVQTVQYLLDTHQPQRIFIEPSGWAHPVELRDQLKNHLWPTPVAFGPIFGFIDLVDWHAKRWLDHQSFWDMVHASDILLATKSDQVEEEQVEEWFEWVEDLYPPKQLWDVLVKDTFNLRWLDGQRLLTYEVSTGGRKSVLSPPVPRVEEMVIRKQPGGWSASWIFEPHVRFDPQALSEFLEAQTGMIRMKGIFQLPDRAFVWQWVRGHANWEWVAYDRDSRLEVLAVDPLDWDAWDQGLKACQMITQDHTKIST